MHRLSLGFFYLVFGWLTFYILRCYTTLKALLDLIGGHPLKGGGAMTTIEVFTLLLVLIGLASLMLEIKK